MKGLANRCAARLPANMSRIAVFTVLVASIALVSLNFDAESVEGMLVWVQDNKGQGSVLFLVAYILGVVLMCPAMVMAMAAGAVFGLVYGTLLVWLGSSVGQTIAFVIGRYLLRELVVQYLTKQFPKWTAIDKALETEGWKLVTLLRLSPIAPWNVLNYALAVTAVPLGAYIIASSLAILPYLVLFVYFGSLARNLADIFTGKTGLGTNTTIVMAVISGVVMVVMVWYTTHLSRKAISQALLTSGDEVTVEMAADADVAELLRVNSGDFADAAEYAASPLGTARASAHHQGSVFSSSGIGGSLELASVQVVGGLGSSNGIGGSSKYGSGASAPPLTAAQQQQNVLKKHTPASASETALLLDRAHLDAGGSSISSMGSAAAASGSRVHLRTSYGGGG